MTNMSSLLLQLSLSAIAVILLTSSQSTYDDDDTQSHDVSSSCGSTEKVLGQLVNAMSQLQRDVTELKNAISTNKHVKGR